MIHTIIGRHIRNIERIDPFQTPHIESVLFWIGPPLMMRIDAAVRAKIMLRRMRIELIELQMLRTFDYAYSTQRHRRDHGALAPANGAIASPGIDDAIRKIELQLHPPAMARCAVLGPNLYPTYFLEHVGLSSRRECLVV